MRLLAALLFAFVATPVTAADKNEDKAKETAVAFLKAVKAKDADAVLKASAAPFAYKTGDDLSVITDADALKKWVKERFDEIGDTGKLPTAVEAMHPFADVKEKVKDEKQRKQLEEVVGKGGFVAVVSVDGRMVAILIRIKDGKAAVVGIGQ